MTGCSGHESLIVFSGAGWSRVVSNASTTPPCTPTAPFAVLAGRAFPKHASAAGGAFTATTSLHRIRSRRATIPA